MREAAARLFELLRDRPFFRTLAIGETMLIVYIDPNQQIGVGDVPDTWEGITVATRPMGKIRTSQQDTFRKEFRPTGPGSGISRI